MDVSRTLKKADKIWLYWLLIALVMSNVVQMEKRYLLWSGPNVIHLSQLENGHLKALVFMYVFEESIDCHLLSSFCDDSNLHISLFKYVLSTMGASKESISKFLIGSRFHVKLRILSPENCKQSLRVKSWKAEVTAEKKQTQDYN